MTEWPNNRRHQVRDHLVPLSQEFEGLRDARCGWRWVPVAVPVIPFFLRLICNQPRQDSQDLLRRDNRLSLPTFWQTSRLHQTAYTKLEGQLQTSLTTFKGSQEERAKLEESLEDVRKQLRSKEEQAKYEKRQLEDNYTAKLAELESRASTAEKRYTEATIQRALQDAASPDAFNPDIVVTYMRQWVKMVDEQPMIDFPDTNADTGEPIITQMTPTDAVKRMKQLSEKYGGLFKSNIVSGIGGTSSAGATGAGGKIDVKKLSMEQYAKLRAENPEALGLAPKSKPRLAR